MVISVFRNRLKDGIDAPYGATAQAMLELVAEQPGFVEAKTFEAADGERVTLATFETMADLEAWGAVAAHRAAQERGRAEFYTSYRLEICEVVRTSTFEV